ncbi:MAG: hypothetical protein BGO09_07185 [Bacteroidetes bacterium 47-18]|nr:MAG: hypothetical protein BGO09_07185 [Bacteroidetes bacterium 47-18]
MKIRKGYWFVLFFAVFSALMQVYRNEFIIKDQEINKIIIVKVLVLFLILFIPGLFLVRWYYKMKDSSER